MVMLGLHLERRTLISTRPGTNACHHHHQGEAGEEGVVMVGGDVLCRRGFSLYGHVGDGDGKGESVHHGRVVFECGCGSYRYLLIFTEFLRCPSRESSYPEPSSSACTF